MNNLPPIDCVLRHDHGGITTLTLNHPQAYNVLSENMFTALGQQLEAIAKDDKVRVVILAANGKHFVLGIILSKCAPTLILIISTSYLPLVVK